MLSLRSTRVRLCAANRARSTVVVVIVALLAGATVASSASAGEYTAQDLAVPPVPSHVRSFGYAINQAGQTAGHSGEYSAVFGANQRRAFFHNGATATTLGTFSGFGESIAYGINAGGKVVGWAASARDGNNHAFVWDGVGMTDLGTISGKGFSAAYGINAAGTIVGTSVIRTGQLHAFSREGRRMKDLGTLPGTTYSQAWAINTGGTIVGDSWTVGAPAAGRAFIRVGTTMTDIGTLGGAEATAYDVNDADSVVGSAQTIGGEWHAYHYAGGVMKDLGALGASSTAYGLNNRGEVVGTSGGRAFLYSDSRLIDLNTLLPTGSGWFLIEAYDITDAGLIVGTGSIGGEYHAFVLKPTLLGRYVPQLRHDLQEVYRPDSAATITDNYTTAYTNRLLDGAGLTLAASDPADPADSLSLSYLGETYPGGQASAATHYLDEANDNRDADAQRLHANPLYANKIYGREIPDGGGKLLQYWMFFYNNPKVFGSTVGGGFGDHEGDWEMIQVHVDSSGTATAATYAQHRVGERCTWDRVERTQSNRPIVYVAHESHASYFTAGNHTVVADNLPDQQDYADGEGERVIPSLVEVTTAPAWMRWPGKWGGADSSPQAPYHQGKWNDAQAFAAQAAACTAPVATAGASASPPSTDQAPDAPPPPQVTARRDGEQIVIDYRIGEGAGKAEPWLLVTTVDGVDDGFTPTSERTLLDGQTAGRVVQPIFLSRGELRVLASIRAENGSRSRIVIVPVK